MYVCMHEREPSSKLTAEQRKLQVNEEAPFRAKRGQQDGSMLAGQIPNLTPGLVAASCGDTKGTGGAKAE